VTFVRVLAAALALVIAAPVFAQPASEKPMYGGSRSAAEQEADKKFIETVIASGYTRRSGSDEAAARGFQSLARRDFGVAMRRFNQAWLLDPENPSAYHGFALVLIERDRNAKEAEAMFKKGAALEGAHAQLLADYGRFLMALKRPKDAQPVLERGTALTMDPDRVRAQRLLADLYYDQRQFEKACPLAKEIVEKVEGADRKAMDFIVTSERCK
jgi:Flp pilus assembly protein TadD